jgi:hypothetical protein
MRQRYPWPASAINEQDMRLLHTARESQKPRIPITTLLAMAVRGKYGVPKTEQSAQLQKVA